MERVLFGCFDFGADERNQIGFKSFINKRIPQLKENGLLYALFLVARQNTNDLKMYDQIKSQYRPLNELTGDYIQFILLSPGNPLRFNNKYIEGPSGLRNFDKAKYDLSINEIKYYFNLLESDIPCMMFKNLITGENIKISANSDTDIYKLVERVIKVCEARFIDIKSSLLNLNESMLKAEHLRYKLGLSDYINEGRAANDWENSIHKKIIELENNVSDEDKDIFYSKYKKIVEKSEACDNLIKNIPSNEFTINYSDSIDKLVNELLPLLAEHCTVEDRPKIEYIRKTMSKKTFTKKEIFEIIGVVVNIGTLIQMASTLTGNLLPSIQSNLLAIATMM